MTHSKHDVTLTYFILIRYSHCALGCKKQTVVRSECLLLFLLFTEYGKWHVNVTFFIFHFEDLFCDCRIYVMSHYVNYDITWLSQSKTSSSAIVEGPRNALSQLKSCQLLHNCYCQSSYQIWSLYLHSLWRYERRYKLLKIGWFGVLNVIQGCWK